MGSLGGALAIGLPPVINHGTEAQKERWLPGIFPGKTSFCLGATEPTGNGFNLLGRHIAANPGKVVQILQISRPRLRKRWMVSLIS